MEKDALVAGYRCWTNDTATRKQSDLDPVILIYYSDLTSIILPSVIPESQINPCRYLSNSIPFAPLNLSVHMNYIDPTREPSDAFDLSLCL